MLLIMLWLGEGRRTPLFSLHRVYMLTFVFRVGVVGLAIAQRLGHIFPKKSTYLVERHTIAGEETRYGHSPNVTIALANTSVQFPQFRSDPCRRACCWLYRMLPLTFEP